MNSLANILEARQTYTAFADGCRLVATGGDPAAVVAEVRRALEEGLIQAAVLFDDATGKLTDVPATGDLAAILACLPAPSDPAGPRTGPGRPKLGVTSREISLLPRHWAWLNRQPGGTSAALRRLIEAAQQENRARDALRQAVDAVYAVMWELAGNAPGFEEASRALFAQRFDDFEALVTGPEWPADLRAHMARLTAVARRLQPLAEAEAQA